MENFLLFAAGVVGMTLILVDGAIMQPFRDWFKATFPEKVSGVIDCYMCCGTWCGFFVGFCMISHNPFVVFVCGCAGGFLANAAAAGMSLIESGTVKNLGQNEH